MFLNIKVMSRELCFDKSVTNNDLFGRQALYFIENFYIEKVTKGVQDTFSLIKSKKNKKPNNLPSKNKENRLFGYSFRKLNAQVSLFHTVKLY